jgi:glycosyltransferase involved in cell wall biosynthesis
MENLTVIIPIEVLDTVEKQEMFIKALSSVDDSNILVVGEKKAIECLSELDLTNFTFATLVNTSKNKNYASQVNFALKSVKSKYFSVLEYDDTYSPIWFKNLKMYIDNDVDNTFAFLPLTEVVEYSTKESIGYSNEAVWASSFSDELGCYDIQSLENYLNFNTSGGVFKTEDFISLGGLKASMELVFWYEFLMRALYKGKRIFVIPKVGYYHVIDRPGCMTTNYANTMSEKEADWWLDLAKKEYFFPHDRKKTYTENE